MQYLRYLFGNSVPAYLWLIVAYGVFVLVIAGYPARDVTPEDAVAAIQNQECVIAGAALYERVESALSCRVATLPLFSGASFAVTWTVLFILFGFVSAWIEVIRATNIRDTARNDTASLVITLLAFVLFVGVSVCGTTAFFVIAIVGFGDVLLDRIVGQAVARRDFGGLIGPGGGGG